MALNIGSSFNSVYRNYQNNTKAVSSSTKKLSSGYRINSAGDDAAGLAISEKMRALITQYAAEYSNAQMDIGYAQTGDGALSTVHESLGRMRELAAQASNGTYSDSDRAALQKEFSQLQSEVSRVYDSANFNGIEVLKDMPALSSFNIRTQDGASAAIDGLTAAINAVSSQRGDFGAQQVGAERAANSAMNARINTQAAESEIRDLDIALAVMENTKNKILHQSSIFMMAQARQNATGVLALLR